LLELYCELLLARFGLLDQNTREPDPGIVEGVCSIVHAAPRTELKELHILRDILMHKYGRDFSQAVMENRDGCVSQRVMNKITNTTPAAPLVDAYIKEIAKAYGVHWAGADELDVQESTEASSKRTEGGPWPLSPSTGEDNNTDEKGQRTSSVSPEPSKLGESKKRPPPSPAPVEDEFEILSRRFAELKKR